MADIMAHKTQCSRFFISYTFILVFFFLFNRNAIGGVKGQSSEQLLAVINIGVIRNPSSPFGNMIYLCMEMAISDFYSANQNYKTRLRLRRRDVDDVLDVDLAVVKLLEHDQVHGILLDHHGETFVAELGRKAHVPIISFSARTSSSALINQYHFRIGLDDLVQARALADICRGFEWKKIVVLYEDTTYGHQFLSRLNNAFQDVEIALAHLITVPTSATVDDTRLHKELQMLKENQTVKVFLVHVSDSQVASQLFALARNFGLMSEGHAWIITGSLSDLLLMSPETRDSMEGFVGIRYYVPLSKDLKYFQERWGINSTVLKINKIGPTMDLNIYGLWAYDTVTALANAIEKVGKADNPSSMYAKTVKNSTNHLIRTSTYGPRLQRELSNCTRFKGLSGEFQMVDGKIKPSTVEIFNVFRNGEKRLGFWTPREGIISDLNSRLKQVKKVVWPGDSVTRPKGWSIPPTGRPLRVGVPWKQGYTEFVKIVMSTTDNKQHQVHAKGFAIDIFLATLKLLPFPIDYTFVCYNGTSDDTNWTYDDMLIGIPEKKFDMIVGDTTILASRAAYVDYSLPYSGSQVVLLINNEKAFDMWIFTKPLSWDLWLAIFVSCFCMGIVIWILERRIVDSATHHRPQMVCLAPIAVLAFQERDIVANRWSSCMLVCWLFTAFVLMQSFTANLSAILTVDQLSKFSLDQDLYIGYQRVSFIKRHLVDELKFNETRLRNYSSPEEFHDAMQMGSKNGGIDVIIDEIPYVKLLLNRYDSRYRIYGQIQRIEGLGFVFPVGSPLAAHFSRAILNVTQGPEMTFIEQKNFGPGYSSQDPLSSTLSQGTSSLSFHHFTGLFIIVGSATLAAVFFSERVAIFHFMKQLVNIIFKNGHSPSPRPHTDDDADDHQDSELVERDPDPGQEIVEPR